MRVRYADSHEYPIHWFRNFVTVVLLAVLTFLAALVLGAHYAHAGSAQGTPPMTLTA